MHHILYYVRVWSVWERLMRDKHRRRVGIIYLASAWHRHVHTIPQSGTSSACTRPHNNIHTHTQTSVHNLHCDTFCFCNDTGHWNTEGTLKKRDGAPLPHSSSPPQLNSYRRWEGCPLAQHVCYILSTIWPTYRLCLCAQLLSKVTVPKLLCDYSNWHSEISQRNNNRLRNVYMSSKCPHFLAAGKWQLQTPQHLMGFLC